MRKYLIILTLFIGLVQSIAAISNAKGAPLPKLELKPLAFNPQQENTKKLAKDLTLKMNKNLFEKGIVLKAKKYGNYYALLDSSNQLDLKYRTLTQDKFSSFQKNKSVITGGLRVGRFVTKKSGLFLRVGFESENVNKGNALKTPHVSCSSPGYWKTGLDSSLGFEHNFNNDLSFMGELSTNISSLNLRYAQNETKKNDARNGTLRLGVKCLFGGR